jgi:hypothetical protein
MTTRSGGLGRMRSWKSEHLRHARFLVATRLKQADSQIREVRLAHPGAFWAVVVACTCRNDRSHCPSNLGGLQHQPRRYHSYCNIRRSGRCGLRRFEATASRRHYAQTEADRQRRIVESFSKAVEQLGSAPMVRASRPTALPAKASPTPASTAPFREFWDITPAISIYSGCSRQSSR